MGSPARRVAAVSSYTVEFGVKPGRFTPEPRGRVPRVARLLAGRDDKTQEVVLRRLDYADDPEVRARMAEVGKAAAWGARSTAVAPRSM